jgi:hypothetical protein
VIKLTPVKSETRFYELHELTVSLDGYRNSSSRNWVYLNLFPDLSGIRRVSFFEYFAIIMRISSIVEDKLTYLSRSLGPINDIFK